MRVVLFEATPEVGGQLAQIPYRIENLFGFGAVAPAALTTTMRSECLSAGIEIRTGVAAMLHPEQLAITTGRETQSFDAVVLATGVRRRKLNIAGERTFANRGVYTNMGADPARFDGARAVVVGGGDDAFEHARWLASHCRSVTLLHRSERFSARSSLRDPVLTDERIQLYRNSVLTAIEGHDGVERVHARVNGTMTCFDADAVFVCIGPEPVSEGFGVSTDAAGYVRVDALQRTSRAGVFAVGDVCCPESPTLATALGHGATAAKMIVQGALVPEATCSDRLSIHGLSFPARIGVYPRERRRRQTLGFDLSFEVDAGAAAPTDSLHRTIDYAAVADVIETMLAQQHYNLIETVADGVATRLLAHFDTRSVRVRVTKPGVPQTYASASIEVERRRA
jgi:thioredoxin reductase (NADPH)